MRALKIQKPPKFPVLHNLLFLMLYAKQNQISEPIRAVEKTLVQMRKGGIFDRIGFGFSRYSTDEYFLVPHFEKMLYDNALLIIAYSAAYTRACSHKPKRPDFEANFSQNEAKIRRCTLCTSRIFNEVMRKNSPKDGR